MVGLASAFTPLVGVQMPIVFGIWLGVRRFFPRWEFNLVVALAWTWITNAITAPPIYYVFLVTGRFLLGRWDNIHGFEAFREKLSRVMNTEASTLETFGRGLGTTFEQFGVPMFVGCIPWALAMGWLGYRAGLFFVIANRHRRTERRKRRLNPNHVADKRPPRH
jgi:uncharacterized protein (DUF2062 family)